MRIKMSYILATALAGGIAWYMVSGQIIISGSKDANPPSIAERQEEQSAELFQVQVEQHDAQPRVNELEIRGRSEADHLVSVRAQTPGIVEERLVNKGHVVEKGQLLCVIERGAREALLARAKAQLIQTEIDFEAQSSLADRGFAARNQTPALQAAMNAALAAVAEAELELSRTEVTSPIAGTVQDPMSSVGDVVQIGDVCVTVIDDDPMNIVGQVSERNIGSLKLGMEADIEFITGQNAVGKIVYMAPSSDAETRTFRVEIEVPNSDGEILDGVTAMARVALPQTPAQLISSAYVTLHDDGAVGVRIVDDEGLVRFNPLTIVDSSKEGLWVTGIPDGARVITVGQDYVIEGQKVEAVEAKDAPLNPSRQASLSDNEPQTAEIQ